MVPTEVLAEQHAVGGARRCWVTSTCRVDAWPTAAGQRATRTAAPSCCAGLAERLTVGHRGGRHPRPADRGRGVRLAGHGGDRRAAPFRGGAAGHAAGQGRAGRPRPSGHDGHAHPAHRRHGHLRRSRPDRARRDAARAGRPSPPSWLPDRGDEHLAWERVREEVAAGHRAFVVCPWWATRRGSRPGRPPRSAPSGSRRAGRPAGRPAARPDGGRRQGGGHGRSSAGARSRCWWPPR